MSMHCFVAACDRDEALGAQIINRRGPARGGTGNVAVHRRPGASFDKLGFYYR